MTLLVVLAFIVLATVLAAGATRLLGAVVFGVVLFAALRVVTLIAGWRHARG